MQKHPAAGQAPGGDLLEIHRRWRWAGPTPRGFVNTGFTRFGLQFSGEWRPIPETGPESLRNGLAAGQDSQHRHFPPMFQDGRIGTYFSSYQHGA
jgi:hypothetical protein